MEFEMFIIVRNLLCITLQFSEQRMPALKHWPSLNPLLSTVALIRSRFSKAQITCAGRQSEL